MILMYNYAINVSEGDMIFGLEMMQHLGEGNVIISPYSIRTALSMLREGAVGVAAKEIDDTIRQVTDDKERRQGYHNLMEILNPKKSDYTLKTANGVWVSDRFPVKEDYKKILTADYNSEADEANFEESPDGSKELINRWVSGKTEGKIPDLFPEGSIDPLTVLVLANALYFKADWQNKFDPSKTQKQGFTLMDGSKVDVDMMRMSGDNNGKSPKFPYTEIDGAQVVVMPYKGGELQKIILLPPKGSSVTDLEQYLRDDVEVLERVFVCGSEKFSRLEVPKSELRGNYSLVSSLNALGINAVFDRSDVNLSGIGPGPLFVGAVVHQTYIKTDEEGSEGAAATGIATLKGMSLERSKVMVIDRPHLEIIASQSTGAVLFMNRIVDPRG
jgi:serpin B